MIGTLPLLLLSFTKGQPITRMGEQGGSETKPSQLLFEIPGMPAGSPPSATWQTSVQRLSARCHSPPRNQPVTSWMEG